MTTENKEQEEMLNEALDVKPLPSGVGGTPIRQSKLINTKMLKAKLNSHLDKAIETMTNALSNEKLAYNAAKDILAAYVTLSNLEMKEESHRADMRFRNYKNKINEEVLEAQRIKELHESTGGTAEVPQAKFSMEYNDNFS